MVSMPIGTENVLLKSWPCLLEDIKESLQCLLLSDFTKCGDDQIQSQRHLVELWEQMRGATAMRSLEKRLSLYIPR